MAGSTSKGLPYPAAGDAPNVHTDIQALAAAADGVFDLYVAKATATTKGDLLVATGSSAITRLPVGANNTVLVADSTQTTGVRWSDVAQQNELNTIMGIY